MQTKIEEVAVAEAVLARVRPQQVEVEPFDDFAETEGGGAISADSLDARIVEVVPEERRDMGGGVQSEAVHTDHLDHPLAVPHEVARGVLDDRVSGLGMIKIKAGRRVPIRCRIPQAWRRAPIRIRVEPAIGVLDRLVGDVPEIASVHRMPDEAMVLLLGDVEQAAIDPAIQFAPLERPVEVAVDVRRRRHHHAGIVGFPGTDEPGGRQVLEGVMIQDDVHVCGNVRFFAFLDQGI